MRYRIHRMNRKKRSIRYEFDKNFEKISKQINDFSSFEKMIIRSKISDVMIRFLIWSLFWKIDIEFIAKTEKKNRFVKINKHVFELFLEQKDDCNIRCWCKNKWFSNKILNDFLIRYWNYRVNVKKRSSC